MKVAPPARSEAGLKEWDCFNNLVQTCLKRAQKALAPWGQRGWPGLACSYTQVIQLHISGCLTMANWACPSWRKFFGFRILTVTQGKPSDSWLGISTSSRVKFNNSPGLSKPKKASPVKALKTSNFCWLAPGPAFKPISLALQSMAIINTNGIGALSWLGSCSCQALTVVQHVFNRPRTSGLTVWTKSMACLATRRIPFRLDLCWWRWFTNSSSSWSSSWAEPFSSVFVLIWCSRKKPQNDAPLSVSLCR